MLINLKLIATIIGTIFMLLIGTITYFVARTYNKIDTIYEYTISHEYDYKATKTQMQLEDSKLWDEVRKINQDVAELKTKFIQSTN